MPQTHTRIHLQGNEIIFVDACVSVLVCCGKRICAIRQIIQRHSMLPVEAEKGSHAGKDHSFIHLLVLRSGYLRLTVLAMK